MDNPSYFRLLFLCFLSLLPDFIISIVFAIFTSNKFWEAFFICLLVIWGGSVVLWLKGAFADTVFYLFTKRSAAFSMAHEMKKENFPTTYVEEMDVIDYLIDVKSDGDLPANTRLAAAKMIGFLAYPQQAGKFLAMFRFIALYRLSLRILSGTYPK